MGPCERIPTASRRRPSIRAGQRRPRVAALLGAMAMAAPALLRAQGEGAEAKQDTSPLSAHVSFTQFVQGPVSGGVDNDASYGGRIDVDAKVDTRLLGLWKGGALEARLATRYGQSASPDAGVLVPVNTALLDPANDGTATGLVTLTYTQMVPLGKQPGDLLVVALGKFYTIDLPLEPFQGGGGITRFMNVNQIAPASEARNIPSVTNGATLAVVLAGQPVFSFAVLDPQPSQRTSGLDSLFEKGVSLVPTLVLSTRFFGRPGQQQLRGSWSSQRITPFDEIPQLILPRPDDTTGVEREGGSWSVTWSASQYVSASPQPPVTGWGVFWQVSFANQRVNPVSHVVNVGVGGNSPFRGRTQDLWGVAYAWTGLSGDFKELFEPLVELRDEHEVELFYNLAMTPWARLTAGLQVIRSARPRIDTVLLPGARLQLVF